MYVALLMCLLPIHMVDDLIHDCLHACGCLGMYLFGIPPFCLPLALSASTQPYITGCPTADKCPNQSYTQIALQMGTPLGGAPVIGSCFSFLSPCTRRIPLMINWVRGNTMKLEVMRYVHIPDCSDIRLNRIMRQVLLPQLSKEDSNSILRSRQWL